MSSNSRCTCHNTLVVKNLNRWFKEKWVDVSRRDKDGKHPPCGRSKAKKSSKGYPKCRPSVKVSDKTPKTSGSMSSGQKRAATKRKRAKKQGVGGKPTIVKEDNPVKVPEDFGRFFDKDYRYEQTYGDLRSNQEVPMKDARFGPSSDKRDQMAARTKRNIIDNVDRLQHEQFDGRENYLTRPHGDMSNEELRERLATVRPYVRDAEGRIAPVPFSDGSTNDIHQRFHPNSSPDRWALERERNLRELESQPTMFYEKNPFTEEFQDLHRSEPMEDAWSDLLKSSAKERAKRRKKEAQKKFKPSTGEFKRPVGGYDPKSATSRRAKFKSRALGGKTKRTGLGRAHLAVEMEHRGIKTKQPLRLEDPRKYMQQIGRQQVRVQQGQVRTPASPSIPQISGYSTRGAPRPKLKPMRAPPINPPVIAGAPHLNMSGGTTGMGMGASAPPPPMPIMASEDLHSGSDLQKRMDWFTVQQLRHMLSESKRLLRQKERKRKGKGDADTSGGGTMLPNHPSNGPKQTNRPEGATEDAKNDPRHFGAHTIGNDVGRGGRTA